MAYGMTIILYEPPYRIQVPEWWIPGDVRKNVLDTRERLIVEERTQRAEDEKRQKQIKSNTELPSKEEILAELFSTDP